MGSSTRLSRSCILPPSVHLILILRCTVFLSSHSLLCCLLDIYQAFYIPNHLLRTSLRLHSPNFFAHALRRLKLLANVLYSPWHSCPRAPVSFHLLLRKTKKCSDIQQFSGSVNDSISTSAVCHQSVDVWSSFSLSCSYFSSVLASEDALDAQRTARAGVHLQDAAPVGHC